MADSEHAKSDFSLNSEATNSSNSGETFPFKVIRAPNCELSLLGFSMAEPSQNDEAADNVENKDKKETKSDEDIKKDENIATSSEKAESENVTVNEQTENKAECDGENVDATQEQVEKADEVEVVESDLNEVKDDNTSEHLGHETESVTPNGASENLADCLENNNCNAESSQEVANTENSEDVPNKTANPETSDTEITKEQTPTKEMVNTANTEESTEVIVKCEEVCNENAELDTEDVKTVTEEQTPSEEVVNDMKETDETNDATEELSDEKIKPELEKATPPEEVTNSEDIKENEHPIDGQNDKATSDDKILTDEATSTENVECVREESFDSAASRQESLACEEEFVDAVESHDDVAKIVNGDVEENDTEEIHKANDLETKEENIETALDNSVTTTGVDAAENCAKPAEIAEGPIQNSHDNENSCSEENQEKNNDSTAPEELIEENLKEFNKMNEHQILQSRRRLSSSDSDAEVPIPKDNPVMEVLWAAENNEVEILRNLLDTDPELINSRDDDSYTPLHRACYNNNVEVIQELLRRGADISAKTVDSWEPLHCASKWDSVEAASLLIQSGANVNALTNGGLTPLHLAASNSTGRRTLELLLWNPFVDVTVVNNSGETAYKIAYAQSRFAGLFEILDTSITFY